MLLPKFAERRQPHASAGLHAGRYFASRRQATLVEGASRRLVLAGEVHVGDIDGDGRPEVVAVEKYLFATGGGGPKIRVFDGRDGEVLWTWRPTESAASVRMVLANLDGKGGRSICASFKDRRRGTGSRFSMARGRNDCIETTWSFRALN